MNSLAAAATSTGGNMFEIAMIVLMFAGFWKVLEKAGQPGWCGIVPIYNYYKLFQITAGAGWYVFLMLIPGINIIAAVMLGLYTARAFGKSNLYAAGLIFLSPIFYALLGFSDAEYYGPKGLGFSGGSQGYYGNVNFNVKENRARDYDVEDVKDAQTVDFEVRKTDE